MNKKGRRSKNESIPKTRQEEIQIIHVIDLRHERRNFISKREGIMLYQDAEIDAMLPARQERLAVFAAVQPWSAAASDENAEFAHASMSRLTTLRTKGRGLIVSRFPRGICRTRLIVLGTAATMREPRSTRRFSHSCSFLPGSSGPVDGDSAAAPF